MKKRLLTLLTVAALTVGSLAGCGSGNSAGGTQSADGKSVEITNVSYDPTRELYEAYNKIFQKHWKEKSGCFHCTVPWRFRKTGTGGCQWITGRCGNTGTGR